MGRREKEVKESRAKSIHKNSKTVVLSDSRTYLEIWRPEQRAKRVTSEEN